MRTIDCFVIMNGGADVLDNFRNYISIINNAKIRTKLMYFYPSKFQTGEKRETEIELWAIREGIGGVEKNCWPEGNNPCIFIDDAVSSGGTLKLAVSYALSFSYDLKDMFVYAADVRMTKPQEERILQELRFEHIVYYKELLSGLVNDRLKVRTLI